MQLSISTLQISFYFFKKIYLKEQSLKVSVVPDGLQQEINQIGEDGVGQVVHALPNFAISACRHISLDGHRELYRWVLQLFF